MLVILNMYSTSAFKRCATITHHKYDGEYVLMHTTYKKYVSGLDTPTQHSITRSHGLFRRYRTSRHLARTYTISHQSSSGPYIHYIVPVIIWPVHTLYRTSRHLTRTYTISYQSSSGPYIHYIVSTNEERNSMLINANYWASPTKVKNILPPEPPHVP